MKAGVDSGELRKALGAFPTGVTVVTAAAAGGSAVGLTVNSFNSLSLDPPLVLWSLSAASPSRAVFENCSHFAVNVLAEDQAQISQRFATRVPDRFAGLELSIGAGGAPLIAGCSAWFECRGVSKELRGDHVLFIGEVERFGCSGRKPLIYCNGKYLFPERESDAALLSIGWGL